jgi:hypothetical protein
VEKKDMRHDIVTLVELPAYQGIESNSVYRITEDGKTVVAPKKTVTLNLSTGFSFINEFEYTETDDDFTTKVHKFCEIVAVGGASEYVDLSRDEILEKMGIKRLSQEDVERMVNSSGIAVANRVFSETELEDMKRNMRFRG